MSQQRIFIAICVLSVVVAASAQSFNAESCQKAFRAALDTYSKSLRAAAQKFAGSLQSNVEGSTDLDAYQADIDKLVNSFSQLANQGTNIDVSKLSQTYIDNLQTLSSLMSTAFNLYSQSPQAALSSYLELGNSLMSAQSKFVQSATAGCSPRTRIYPQ